MAEWQEGLTAERNIDSSRQTLGSQFGSLSTKEQMHGYLGDNSGEVKGGKERNWPPYHPMPTAQDKCSL